MGNNMKQGMGMKRKGMKNERGNKKRKKWGK